MTSLGVGVEIVAVTDGVVRLGRVEHERAAPVFHELRGRSRLFDHGASRAEVPA